MQWKVKPVINFIHVVKEALNRMFQVSYNPFTLRHKNQ